MMHISDWNDNVEGMNDAKSRGSTNEDEIH
jgi:hypothetical protein